MKRLLKTQVSRKEQNSAFVFQIICENMKFENV